MPWKDDSQPNPAPGPWDAPGAAVAPPPKARLSRAKASKPAPSKPPRPWDEATGAEDAPTPPKRPRLPSRRSRAADKAQASGRAPIPRPRSRPKAVAPGRSGFSFDALARRLSREAADRLGGAHGRRVRLALALGATLGLACGWAASGVYRVAPGETGVVQRFGAYVGEVGPGLHYHLPWPLARARAVPTDPMRTADGAAAHELDGSAAMLAADGSPVQVSYALAWRVVDPRRYLFHVADGHALLGQLAEGAVRRAVGAASLTSLLTADHGTLETSAAAELQRTLDRLGMGVDATSLEVRGVDPADAAQAGARDLATAVQDARTAQANAAADRDRALAQARGEAAKALQDAGGVADQEIAEAKGEADRFTALDAAYRQAPDATRERLYIETMERVLKATNKVVVDAPKGSTLVLPSSVMPSRAADPAGAPPSPPAAAIPAAPSGGAG